MPISSTPNPAPTTSAPPSLQDALTAKIVTAQKLEDEAKWVPALDAWLKIARDFPAFGVGNYHLETLINRFRYPSSPITLDEFKSMRGQIDEAAERGILSAMLLLGAKLHKTEPKVALKWLSAAREQGNADALTQLGFMSAETGQAEFVKAAEYFQAAADKGHVGGKFALGECYLRGRGVTKDQKRGVEFLRAAAAGGDSRAMNVLGDCYTHGTGVKQDFAEAFQLFTHASEQGDLQALGNLGVLYMTGRGVPEPNPSKGAELFQRGARAGESSSMFNFARCLEEGLGVAKNEIQAQEWYRKAAQAGEARAANWCKTHNVPFTQG